MPKLKPHIAEVGKHFIKCPKCSSSAEFSLFYTNITPELMGIPLIPFHRTYSAVCPKCSTVFYINPEKGNRLLMKGSFSLSSEDLREERWKNV